MKTKSFINNHFSSTPNQKTWWQLQNQPSRGLLKSNYTENIYKFRGKTPATESLTVKRAPSRLSSWEFCEFWVSHKNISEGVLLELVLLGIAGLVLVTLYMYYIIFCEGRPRIWQEAIIVAARFFEHRIFRISLLFELFSGPLDLP